MRCIKSLKARPSLYKNVIASYNLKFVNLFLGRTRRWEISMARITIEDCLERVENRYELVHLATKRVKQLREGAEPLVKSKNKEVVTALREIAAGKIKHAPISEYDSDEF